jgi:ubiquinone/menaquinone biosynthesis C-methylase UbiE
MLKRVPLNEEPISGADAVKEYDKGARLYMAPEYKYFVWKILSRGITGGRVLDIGTGSGRLAIELAKAKNCHFAITALDISGNMLETAQKNAIEAGVADRIWLVQGTADHLPFPDGSFDLVISYASLHHWFQPLAVLSEARRVARPGGRIIIRDNQRIYGNPFWESFIRGISLFMNKRHRENWPKAILASYTLPEVQTMLEQPGLTDYRAYTDFIKFDVCIETVGRLT